MLSDILNDPARKSALVKDSVALLEQEVDRKSGLSGMAIKMAFKAVRGIKPGFLDKAVEELLPHFAAALEPMVERAKAAGESSERYFGAHSGDVADALLATTDAKASRSTQPLIKSSYEKLRGSAKKQVEEAAPRVGALIDKHAPAGS